MLRRIRRATVARLTAVVTAGLLVFSAGPWQGSAAALAAESREAAARREGEARRLDLHELQAIRGRQMGGLYLLEEERTGTRAYHYTYTCDAAGNRLTKYDGTTTENYTYDDADKLTAAGSKSYGYDNAGNLTTVTVGSNVTTLSWDYAGRLSEITYPNSSINSFTYNDLGQRTSKTDSAGTSASLYDGSRVLADSRADYTNGGLTGLVSERASGTTLTYHGDQLGSTRGLTNGSQTVTASRERDAWGNVVASSGTLAGPFGFVGGQGYQQDSDSGLLRLGARYYDPSVGRFISRDPSGYGGGDPNLYRYCSNSPANATDPEGLMAQSVLLAGGPPGWVAFGVVTLLLVAGTVIARNGLPPGAKPPTIPELAERYSTPPAQEVAPQPNRPPVSLPPPSMPPDDDREYLFHYSPDGKLPGGLPSGTHLTDLDARLLPDPWPYLDKLGTSYKYRYGHVIDVTGLARR